MSVNMMTRRRGSFALSRIDRSIGITIDLRPSLSLARDHERALVELQGAGVGWLGRVSGWVDIYMYI